MDKLALKKEKHIKQVNKLSIKETRLEELISAVGNHELNEAYFDWVNQRRICNETYVSIVKLASKK